MAFGESNVKFLRTSVSRLLTGQARVQTGTDVAATKHGADVVNLNTARGRATDLVTPTTPTVTAFEFLLVHRFVDFFDEIGQALKIQGIILNMSNNYKI